MTSPAMTNREIETCRGDDTYSCLSASIGSSRAARRARAFGMQIHYHNRKRLRPEIEEEHEATYWESLDQMVSRIDVLSINCPHTPSTFHLMNARRLKLMKPSAVIVNTSRGEVIDENALTRMLRAGELAGAGLDDLLRLQEAIPAAPTIDHQRVEGQREEGAEDHQRGLGR